MVWSMDNTNEPSDFSATVKSDQLGGVVLYEWTNIFLEWQIYLGFSFRLSKVCDS